MSETKYFKQPLPRGWRLLTDEMEVAGVQHRLDDALSLLKGNQLSFDFEADPGNEHDANAIKVIGKKHGLMGVKRFHIGFVPREVAELIAEQVPTTKAVDMISPRLTKVWFGDQGVLKIFFDIAVKEEEYNLFAGKPNKKGKAKEELPFDASIKIPKSQDKRNLLGNEFEQKGLIENAIQCYQANVASKHDGTFPYDRLAIIYRKRKQYDKEIEILNKAIDVFENVVNPLRVDRLAKLGKLKERLGKAQYLADRAKAKAKPG